MLRFKLNGGHYLLIILHLLIVESTPIDVTGPNIKYYKLTPNEGSGSYDFDYGTQDGAERSERGYIKMEPGSDKPLMVIMGSFKYPDPNGGFYEVSYIADEQGYRILPNKVLPAAVSPVVPTQLKNVPKSVLGGNQLDVGALRRLGAQKLVTRVSNVLVAPPRRESKVFKVSVRPGAKLDDCAPGTCVESKLFQIKGLKFG